MWQHGNFLTTYILSTITITSTFGRDLKHSTLATSTYIENSWRPTQGKDQSRSDKLNCNRKDALYSSAPKSYQKNLQIR